MEFVRLEHFTVIGIEARTSNAREATPDGAIGKLWGRFLSGNLAARIPNRADGRLVAVYSDYASDENGEYTYLLGAKMLAVGEIPAGMAARNVPTGRYAVFTSERGPAQRVVVETWKKIWAEPRTAQYARSYRADFELYDDSSPQPADTRVRIYIGVRD